MTLGMNSRNGYTHMLGEDDRQAAAMFGAFFPEFCVQMRPRPTVLLAGRPKGPISDAEKLHIWMSRNAPGLTAPSNLSGRHNFANRRGNCHSRSFPMKDAAHRNRSGKFGLRDVWIPIWPAVDVGMDSPYGFERRADCNLVRFEIGISFIEPR